MSNIQAPTHCPSCASTLEWKNHILYCVSSSCGSQVQKQLEHFSKSLKIKGLGPAAIAKLELTDLNQLYSLTEEVIAEALSSVRLAEKLIEEIEKSKAVSLNKLLPAFGIRLIGTTAAEKLSSTCKHITEINEDTSTQAGLGPKATASLLDWLAVSYPLISNLPFSFAFDQISKAPTIAGYVCISGKLQSFKTKALAAEALMSKGYVVKGTLTKQVTILVNESGIESSKTKKARDSGITIVTNLYDFIGE